MILNATSRTQTKKKVKLLREDGIVPGVVYGHGKDTQNVQVTLRDLQVVYKAAGDSSLVDLVIDQQAPVKTLIQEISHHPLNDRMTHVDFYAVNMNEAVHAEVVLHFIGVAGAVKELGGILVKNKAYVNIKCLPGALIKEFNVDIAPLKTFEDFIYLRDLKFPEGIEVLDNQDAIVVTVTPPRSDEELAALNEKVSENVANVAGVTKETDTVATAADSAKK